MIRPISISLSPNTEADDTLLSFSLLFQPWKWKGQRKAIERIEEKFRSLLGVRHAVSFNSGRSSFMALLASMGFEKEDEILIQAFTCNAVPNPILWAGLKPVYVDCRKEDYNMDPADLEQSITPKSRAVVVQHTFGIPADMEAIQEICKRHNLKLIEDCAHALGATYKGKQVGTFGDAAFFSFSRDKVISSVYGGMATTNDEQLAKRLRDEQRKSGYPSRTWILQQLLHPPFMNWIILPTYRVLGKYLLIGAQFLHILSKAVHFKEKRGERPGYFPKALPSALAILAAKQLDKLERFNEHRRKLAAYYAKELQGTFFTVPFYKEGSIFLRLPLRHADAHDVLAKAWERNILLGDWYTTPVAPFDTDMSKMDYKRGSTPVAEELAKTTLNLPTHIRISEKEADLIVRFLKSVDL